MYTAKVSKFIVIPICDIKKDNRLYDTQQMKQLIIHEIAFDKSLDNLARTLEEQVNTQLLSKLETKLTKSVEQINGIKSAAPKRGRHS